MKKGVFGIINPKYYNRIILIGFLILIAYPGLSKPSSFELTSPDHQIVVKIELSDKIYYAISAGSQVLMKENYLGLEMEAETLGKNPKLIGSKRSTLNENIQRPIPLRNAVIHNHCNVLLLKFRGDYAVEFRAYNDGVAYRIITDKASQTLEVLNEQVHLQFPETFEAVVSPTKSFKTSYEISYVKTSTEEFASLEKSTVPILMDAKGSYKILISEADLFDYPCLFLKGEAGNSMEATFPKCPLEFGPDGDRSVKILKEANYIAKTKGKRTFPWRVFMISTDDQQIFENEMVFKLSRPNELGNTDWIKPGQVAWEWWHGGRLFGVDFKAGFNTDSYKYYIDFAATFKIPYIIMDGGWSNTVEDPFTPKPSIDLTELIQYGQSKNVRIILWLSWLTVDNHMELFKTYSDWGIAGVKIDFMERSDQWMVDYYERVAREAAKYHLFVDYHGAFKPAGMERTLPNILSYEGVVGMEQNIWFGRATTDNNAYLPFIRNVVGPMDFTPGAMKSVHPKDYKATSWTNPVSIGTRAYQMALYTIFESGLQMLSDNPFYYYQEKECTDFITRVPVVWEEAKVLDAKAGAYCVVAKIVEASGI